MRFLDKVGRTIFEGFSHIDRYLTDVTSEIKTWASSYKENSLHEINLRRLEYARKQQAILKQAIIEDEEQERRDRERNEYFLSIARTAQEAARIKAECELKKSREYTGVLEAKLEEKDEQLTEEQERRIVAERQVELQKGQQKRLRRELMVATRQYVEDRVDVIMVALDEYPAVYLNSSGKVELISDGACDLLRIPRERIVDQHYTRFISGLEAGRTGMLRESMTSGKLTDSYQKNVRIQLGEENVRANVKIRPIYKKVMNKRRLIGTILYFDRSFWSFLRRSYVNEEGMAKRQTIFEKQLDKVLGREEEIGPEPLPSPTS